MIISRFMNIRGYICETQITDDQDNTRLIRRNVVKMGQKSVLPFLHRSTILKKYYYFRKT